MERDGQMSDVITWVALAALSAMMLLFASCSDDEKVMIQRPVSSSSLSFGVVSDGQIETDLGNCLIPDESSVEHNLTEGERVFVRSTILEKEDARTFRVRIDKYYQLLTKEYVHSSTVTEEELGDNPVNVEKAWFGGGYLNMHIALKHNPSSGATHSINLVYDDLASSADTARFMLCHNANGDTEHTTTGYANASFPLEELLADGQQRIYVELEWKWYNRWSDIIVHHDGGYYSAQAEEPEENEMPDDGSVNIE